MMELNQYINKAFDFEEKGYVDEAIRLCSKCKQVFPEYKDEIELEIAKINYRNGREEVALPQFLALHNKTENDEVHGLIIEAYYGIRKQEFDGRYLENYRQLREYQHFFGNKEPLEVRYYPILVTEDCIWYYDSVEKVFKDIKRCRIVMEKPSDDICLGNDLLWLEDILMLEKMTRKANPLMDMENALLIVYRRETWELLLQLLDLGDLLKIGRIVFYDGKEQLESSLLENRVEFPTMVVGNLSDEVSQTLNKSYWKCQQKYEEHCREALEYYKENGEVILNHIKQGKPKILFMTSRFTTALQYHIRDCMQAAEKLGCETELIIERNNLERVTIQRIIKILALFKPDIVFEIDYFRVGIDAIENLIWVTWVQDKLPQSTGNQELIMKLGNRDIVVSPFFSDLQGKHWNMNYGMKVLKMPLSANQDIYKKRELSQKEREQYTCDICYVANASDYRQMVKRFKESLPEFMYEDYQIVMDVYFQLMENEVFFHGYEENLEILKTIMGELKIVWPEYLVSDLAEKTAIWISYSRYKSLVVEWLLEAGYTDIKLYGKEWGNDEKFKPYAMGVIENGEKLSKALQASKIVLGVHPVFSLSARVIEGIASGAFCLVNDIAGADIANAREYFAEGTELIYYYGKQDFIEKVGYYLNHEEQREKIIEAGQHKIAQALTYEVIWKRLFMEIAQLVEEREDS